MALSRAFHLQQVALRDLLRDIFGPRCQLAGVRVVHEDGEYRVLLAALRTPDRTIAIKLCDPGDSRAGSLARAAALARLVRSRTDVPTYDVLAVDASGEHWPWAYLIASHIEGRRWNEVVPLLETAEQRQLYEQLGRAVATLHSIRFPCYGEMRPDGEVAPAPTYLDPLAAWAAAHIAEPRHAALFLQLLADRAALFADIGPAQLTHEDLNPNNLLVRHDGGAWRLAGVLDFDKAWAGCGESDLARLELWRGMAGDGFWQGYTGLLPIPTNYPARRALYQLLWCLEYAQPTPEHNADTAAVCAALGIPPVIFTSASSAR